MHLVKKRCSRCKKTKATTSFSKKKGGRGGLAAHCKACQKQYWVAYYENAKNRSKHIRRAVSHNQARRERIRAAVQTLKQVPCADCETTYPYYVMQFDHQPTEKKLATISRLMQAGAAEEKLMSEIRKCHVVCANCHAERTYQRIMGKLQEQS
jgi:hypothetical protein